MLCLAVVITLASFLPHSMEIVVNSLMKASNLVCL